MFNPTSQFPNFAISQLLLVLVPVELETLLVFVFRHFGTALFLDGTHDYNSFERFGFKWWKLVLLVRRALL